MKSEASVPKLIEIDMVSWFLRDASVGVCTQVLGAYFSWP